MAFTALLAARCWKQVHVPLLIADHRAVVILTLCVEGICTVPSPQSRLINTPHDNFHRECFRVMKYCPSTIPLRGSLSGSLSLSLSLSLSGYFTWWGGGGGGLTALF